MEEVLQGEEATKEMTKPKTKRKWIMWAFFLHTFIGLGIGVILLSDTSTQNYIGIGMVWGILMMGGYIIVDAYERGVLKRSR